MKIIELMSEGIITGPSDLEDIARILRADNNPLITSPNRQRFLAEKVDRQRAAIEAALKAD